MSTYRFPLRGKIGVVGAFGREITMRLLSKGREPAKAQQLAYLAHGYLANDMRPLTEEQIRNLPAAHRYSA